MSDSKILVIGGGVIGLACAYSLRKAGQHVMVIDRDFKADKASFGNAGAIAVTDCMPMSHPGVLKKVPKWLFDPLGPLSVNPSYAHRLIPWLWHFYRAGRPSAFRKYSAALAALNDITYEHLIPMLADLGMRGDLETTGSLVLYKDRRSFETDQYEWSIKTERGVNFELLTRDQLVELEPAVGPTKTFGVFQPAWSLLKDPKKLLDHLATWLRQHGSTLVADDVTKIIHKDSQIAGVQLGSGRVIQAAGVVVACGAWSAILAKQANDKVLLESERGYNTTIVRPELEINRPLVFAEEKFVISPLSIGLRIGGAAEFSGLTASPNFDRAKALLTLATRHVPSLAMASGVEWMGHRSSTPDSVPIIGKSPNLKGLVYAFGHGHLGLTQAASTGRLVADFFLDKPDLIDISPYSIQRFSA